MQKFRVKVTAHYTDASGQDQSDIMGLHYIDAYSDAEAARVVEDRILREFFLVNTVDKINRFVTKVTPVI